MAEPRLMERAEYPSIREIMLVVASLQFKPFSEWDWRVFAGCESETPMIAHASPYTFVLDGTQILVTHEVDFGGGLLLEVKAAQFG